MLGDTQIAAVAPAERRPVAIPAALLAIAIAACVAWSAQISALRMAVRSAGALANVRTPLKPLTLTLQRAAFESGHILPVYGSSELYCCGNPYRPTQLFASEPTGFDAFAIGRPGMGNLLFTQTFGALGRTLQDKKLVLIDSPPWFSNTDEGEAQSYAGNFSPEIAGTFIFESPISLPLKEATARRMLDYPATLADEPLLRLAVRTLADPTPLHLAEYFAIAPLGRLTTWVERVRDAVLTRQFLRPYRKPPASSPPHRGHLDWSALAARATKIAERRNSTNPFGFPNRSYSYLLKNGIIGDALAVYHSGATNRNGELYPVPVEWEQSMSRSVEWTDLQLAASVLHELGARPFVWTMPMPGPYDDYTVLSAPARQAYYERWTRALDEARVPGLDFRFADEEPYFLTDTGAHFSPRGWILADLALDMFWHDRPIEEIRVALATLARQVPAPPAAFAWPTAAKPRGEAPR